METISQLAVGPLEFSLFDLWDKQAAHAPQENYEFELLRIASFSNVIKYHEGRVDSLGLAGAGFYYDQNERVFRCFQCAFHCGLLEADDAVSVARQHDQQSPSCLRGQKENNANKPLCLKSSSNNQKSGSSSSDEDDYAEVGRRTDAQTDRIETDSSSSPFTSVDISNQAISHVQAAEEADPGNMQYPTHTRGTAQAGARCQSLPAVAAVVTEPVHGHSSLDSQRTRQTVPDPAFTAAIGAASNARSRDMYREEARLGTFANWPATANVRAIDLAHQAFFYLGTEDKVQCAFCNGVLCKWESGDDITEEHKEYFPNCPFVLGQPTNNVPLMIPEVKKPPSPGNLEQHPTRQVPPPPESLGATASVLTAQGCSGSLDAARQSAAVGQNRTPPSPATALEGAAHPDYQTFEARLATYRPEHGWKTSTVTPKALSEAGFYFAGSDDNVRCFNCDGGLRNWEYDDVPWTEHARWFPNCSFLLAQKGQSFIQQVQKRFPVSKQIPNTPNAQANASSYQTAAADPLHDVPLNQALKEGARHMGFQDSMIKTAVAKHMQRTGRPFMNMQDLTDELLDLESDPVARARTAASARTSAPVVGQSRTAQVAPSPVRTKEKQGASNNKDDMQREAARKTEEEEKTSGQSKSKKNKKKKKKEKLSAESSSSSDPAGAAAEPMPTNMIYGEDEESRSLHEENRQLKEQRMCKVCMDEEVNIVFLPCGHLVACANCAPALRLCPICRALIRGSVRTYLS